MKTSVTLALLASLLVSGAAFAHGSHSSPILSNGGNSPGQINMPNLSNGGDSGGQINHHMSVDGGNVSDPVKILDRRHDDRWFDKGHERFDRVRRLERELLRLTRHDRGERDKRFIELEIKRLRFEIFKLEHRSMTADVS